MLMYLLDGMRLLNLSLQRLLLRGFLRFLFIFFLSFFFLSGFSFTTFHEPQNWRGRVAKLRPLRAFMPYVLRALCALHAFRALRPLRAFVP